MTVAELSGRLTAAEELMWMAYYNESPFGDYRSDLRNAQVAQLIHNTNAKKARPLEDFMLFKSAITKKGTDPRDFLAKVKAMQGKK